MLTALATPAASVSILWRTRGSRCTIGIGMASSWRQGWVSTPLLRGRQEQDAPASDAGASKGGRVTRPGRAIELIVLCVASALLALPGLTGAVGAERSRPPLPAAQPTATTPAARHGRHTHAARTRVVRGRVRGRTPLARVRPVAVCLGRHLVASELSLHAAIRRVRAQVPFAIKTPRFVPVAYHHVHLVLVCRRPQHPRYLATCSGHHVGLALVLWFLLPLGTGTFGVRATVLLEGWWTLRLFTTIPTSPARSGSITQRVRKGYEYVHSRAEKIPQEGTAQ